MLFCLSSPSLLNSRSPPSQLQHPSGEPIVIPTNKEKFWRKCVVSALEASIHDSLTHSVIVHAFRSAEIFSHDDMNVLCSSLPSHPDVLHSPFDSRRPELSGYILTEAGNLSRLVEKKSRRRTNTSTQKRTLPPKRRKTTLTLDITSDKNANHSKLKKEADSLFSQLLLIISPSLIGKPSSKPHHSLRADPPKANQRTLRSTGNTKIVATRVLRTPEERQQTILYSPSKPSRLLLPSNPVSTPQTSRV